ncbi:rab-GTPase-TBC domain-containing protein [Trichoderma longibrachiatum]
MWSSSGSGKKPANSVTSPFWRPPPRDGHPRRSVTNPAGRDGSSLVVGAAYSHADVLKFDSLNRMAETTPPPQRGALASSSPPFKSYINFLSNTNDDWKADEDEMLGYEDDDGDDFGLPSLSNMKRRSKRIATQNNRSDPWQEALSPVGDGSFGRVQARRYSNSADIAAERPASTYPMPKKSEGKILRPQYKDILKDPANALHLISYPSIPSNAPQKEADAINSRITRINKFKRLLQASSISLPDLRSLAWSGVPHEVRAMTWQLLLSYLPTNSERRVATLERKRKEYLDGVKQAFERGGTTASSSSAGKARGLDEAVWHQISIDIPRTNPHIELYSYEATQRSLERILYVWAVRHPASGYVQGINDLVTPFWEVFLGLYITDSDIETGMDPGQLPKSVLDAVEADSFWCLTKLLDGIQDHYIVAQPGIQRQVAALRDLTARIDSNLSKHLEQEGVEFIQFSFRWMNCLLMREISVKNTIRMWDTYLAEEQGFSEFHLYVCAALLVKWSDKLVKMDFQEVMMFLQSLPTKTWTEKDIELLLSEAFIWQIISMRPLVIADSDDESDSSEHHTAAPAVTPTLPPAPIRSPEQGSVATASTGSAIFQQIFNEQNGAALEKVQQLQRDLDDAPHESSAMTIPDVPFQRTTKGFYHSSTTTTTESPMDKFPDIEVADPCAAWPRMTSREEKLHEKEVGVVDPWEVPSSPDAPRPLERQSKRNSHATHDYAYKRDGLFSANDALPDRHSDFDEAAQRRSRKRRRLDESRDTLSATDEVDLIMLPSSSKSILQHGDETGAASSISLPTMPLDAGSTSSPTHPSPIGREQQTQTQYAVGSSGTATNINTQRTQMSSNQNFSSLAPEEPDVRVGTTKAEYRNYRLRRSSSPDIISTLAPVLKNAAPKPDQAYRDGRDASAHQPPPRESQSGENEAEFVAHPTPMVKSKKKRGRPRKPPETGEPLPMKPAAGPVSAAADGTTQAATTQKKRRGRPKKQSAEAALDGAPPPAATAVCAPVADSDTRAKLCLAKTSASAERDDIHGDDSQAATAQSSPSNVSVKGAPDEASSAGGTTRRGQDQAAPGSRVEGKDLSASQNSSDKPKEEDVPKEPRQPAARAREEKSGCDKKGSSAQGISKPLYRVGLSKRFKIAPLLKSVRKP